MPLIRINRIVLGYPTIANYYINAVTFDGGSASFPIELDPAIVTAAGEYAVVYSSNPFENYVGATASFTGATSLSVLSITSAATGDLRTIGGSNYYCLIVTVG